MPSSEEGMTDGQQFRSAPSTCIEESQSFAGRYKRKVMKKDQNGELRLLFFGVGGGWGGGDFSLSIFYTHFSGKTDHIQTFSLEENTLVLTYFCLKVYLAFESSELCELSPCCMVVETSIFCHHHC